MEELDRTTVVHCKKSAYDIYIGRPSDFGNPFSHKENTLAKFKANDLENSIELYKDWILSQPKMIERIKSELKGKVLGCWCKPKKCHGDILAKIANEDTDTLEF